VSPYTLGIFSVEEYLLVLWCDSYDKMECLLVLAWTRIRLEIQEFGTGGIYEVEYTGFRLLYYFIGGFWLLL
jgi:hypothetical protein